MCNGASIREREFYWYVNFSIINGYGIRKKIYLWSFFWSGVSEFTNIIEQFLVTSQVRRLTKTCGKKCGICTARCSVENLRSLFCVPSNTQGTPALRVEYYQVLIY